MSAITDLKDLVADLKGQITNLQASIDAHQEQDGATIAALNAQIDALEDAVANGASPEQLAEIASQLTVVRDSVLAAKADIESGGNTSSTTSSTTEAP